MAGKGLAATGHLTHEEATGMTTAAAAELGVTVHMINVWRTINERKIPA